MTKYRKLPVVIDAVQFGNDIDSIIELTLDSDRAITFNGDTLSIKTLEGTMTANKGDYIIKGVKGEIYPCKADIFVATYVEVE